MTNIRLGTIRDISQLSVLFDSYRVFYKNSSNLSASVQFLSDRLNNNESVIFVSTENKIITGFAQLYPLFSSTRMKKLWLLNDLFILPEFRSKGHARALLQRIKEHCRQTSAAGVMLETAVSNKTANALYRSSGFIIDTDHNYYNWSPDE